MIWQSENKKRMLQQGLNIELEGINDESVDLPGAGWPMSAKIKKTLRSQGSERQFT